MIKLDESRPLAHARELLLAFDKQNPMCALHGDRVAALAVEIADWLGIREPELTTIRVAAELHDLGKLELPSGLLEKAESLSRDEWELMSLHPALGERILSDAGSDFLKAVATCIRHHHEFYGGNGYPDGLAGEAIPLASRIIAVADAYEGMAAARAYRDMSSHRHIVDVLGAEVGIKWDPSVFGALVAVLTREGATPAWWTVPVDSLAASARHGLH
jgi:HD-GYP domain-containing protein (c-di-GMP phosphodiesterase class II)